MAVPIPPVPALPVTAAPGRMNVDFEQRVDFARLREYRLGRAMGALEASGLGALLVFDNNNIRDLTGVAVAEGKGILEDTGVAGLPVGVDFAEIPTIFELQRQGIEVRDGQQVMLDARQLKSPDEIALLTTAAAMVDGVYQDITDALRPGIRENEVVALANKRLYEMGSDDVESVNAVSGERCNPHPHNFSDRMIRPGEQAFFDIMHSYNGYRTCYYRCFVVGRASQPQKDAYNKAREWIDAAIQTMKPRGSTDHGARPSRTARGA